MERFSPFQKYIRQQTLCREAEQWAKLGVLSYSLKAHSLYLTRVGPYGMFLIFDSIANTLSFLILNISGKLLKLQLFQSITALDLNIGHYNIKLDSYASEMFPIILP